MNEVKCYLQIPGEAEFGYPIADALADGKLIRSNPDGPICDTRIIEGNIDINQYLQWLEQGPHDASCVGPDDPRCPDPDAVNHSYPSNKSQT